MSENTATSAVSGVLIVGEAHRVGGELLRRARGSALLYYVFLVVLMLLLLPMGAMIAEALHISVGLGVAAGGIAAYFIYTFGVGRFVRYRFRRKFAARGLPLELPLRFELTPDALVYELGGVKQVAQWSCVTELFLSHGYWIFAVQGSSFFAPAHFFASPDQERSFVAVAMAHLSEDARARSSDATAYLRAAAQKTTS